MPIDEEWVQDEENLEAEISDIFNDPNTMAHAVAYSNAQQRAHLHAAWARSQLPQKDISMAADIHEDEFADDPEVVNCLLNPEEQKFKELCWSNENRDWLRQQQEKVYRLKLAADQPKQTRRRKKRPRIGEGQTSPASTPAEAAINVIKERAWSKRINYDAIRSLFDVDNGGPGSMMGSAATSRQTSYAGSAIGHDDAAEDDDETDDSGPGDDDEGPGSPDVSDEEVYDADGYDDDNGFEEPEDDLHED
jgi:transcription factor IIIB subunit 2